MPEFTIVSDEYRKLAIERPSRGAQSELVKSLISGNTVFVPLNGKNPNTITSKLYTSAKRRGMKAVMRKTEVDGEKGYVVWFEGADKKAK